MLEVDPIFPIKNRKDLYTLKSVIGRGKQGTVYLALSKEGISVALKVMKATADLCDLESEIRNMKELSLLEGCHSSIIGFYDSFQDEQTKKYMLVSKYYRAQTLNHVSVVLSQQYSDKSTSPYYCEIILNLLVDLLNALEYIHNHGIVHGDIKLENILVEMDDLAPKEKNIKPVLTKLRPVLIDFGLSLKIKPGNTPKISGSPLYMAPELFELAQAQILDLNTNIYKGVSPETDIWSLGICIYAILIDIHVWPAEIQRLDQLSDYVVQQKQTFNVQTENQLLNTLIEFHACL